MGPDVRARRAWRWSARRRRYFRLTDLLLTEQVIIDHDQLVVMRTTADYDAFVLLALQAPVASDLRTVVSTIQNVADVERMGALARYVTMMSTQVALGAAA